MVVSDLLSKSLFPLKKSDTNAKAIELMNEFCVSHLPVVEDGICIGYVNTLDLLGGKPKQSIESQINTGFITQLRMDQHFFEIVRIFAEHSTTTMAVADHTNKFCGIISISDLLNFISHSSAFKEQGSVITLEMGVRDYSLAEIARIIEYNNAKILGILLTTIPDSTKMQIHIKLNVNDLKNIMATLSRYDFTVVASFMREDDIDILRDRYNSFMKYLNL